MQLMGLELTAGGAIARVLDNAISYVPKWPCGLRAGEAVTLHITPAGAWLDIDGEVVPLTKVDHSALETAAEKP